MDEVNDSTNEIIDLTIDSQDKKRSARSNIQTGQKHSGTNNDVIDVDNDDKDDEDDEDETMYQLGSLTCSVGRTKSTLSAYFLTESVL
jgi:hypothetical protein